jgi:hypothetical protein
VRHRDRGAADAPHAARRARLVALLAAALLAPALLIAPAGAPAVQAGEPTDRLPDLRAAKPSEFRIVTSNGRRLLRFTALMSNRGAGAMEIRASRSSAQAAWDVQQRIYDNAGGSRLVGTGATLRYSGDGHNHWHVVKMMSYHLWSGAGTRGDEKIGFCFFDTNRVDSSLPGSPSAPFYREAWCGTRNALLSRTGISVGWGDKYGYNLAYQWIDISGLPGGTYTVRAKVDPQSFFSESNDGNNCGWTTVRFSASGSSVSVVGSGTSCVNDYAGTMYEPYIEWAYEQGITGGCELDLFCTGNSVTRAQAASFIARALALPAPTQDWFDDDDGKTHEYDINRLAEAGITGGCGERLYCPSAVMTRAQMASLLVRALALPPATEPDRFSDDDGSTHEADIDALAEAGITGGCAPSLYCPTSPVTRGQIVAFLYRGSTE